MDPIIKFENVNFAYADTPILKDVSFHINPKEFIGIIGPNGGGKTTLLKLIMGLVKPSSGKIQVFGKPPQQSLQKIGYVPQSWRFDKQFPISVFELVLSGRLSHLPWYGIYSKADHQAVHAMLEIVGLTKFKDAAFGTLSGGQAQRALIARALVSEPDLLLLDEPTASVDAQAEAMIYSILKELHKKMTIMMVTHDLKTAIDQVEKVVCVQHTVMSLLPQEVCEHFAFGLYHMPLIKLSSTTDKAP